MTNLRIAPYVIARDYLNYFRYVTTFVESQQRSVFANPSLVAADSYFF